jgi:hypothetical protein
MVVGVFLVVLALRQWRAACDWRGLGLLLSAVVPKNLLLSRPVSSSERPGSAAVRPQASSYCSRRSPLRPVAVPVVAHLVASARMRGPFERLREWLVENNVTIMVVVLLVIGVVMIGNSIASL